MRRILVLIAALTLMWGLRGLPTAAGEGGADPLTLAAIGFVVLAAFTVGELGAQLGLPKVTGYIVAGVALGPQVADILSTSVVGEMQVFNTLALGLIATAAGLELDLKAIRRVWKVLTSVVVLKVPLLILMVGGTFVGLETALPSLDLPSEAIMPVALVVAVLGIGTSPAIALAVVNDGRAKGRLTDLLLAIAVVKDLVVVICLAIALALAKSMLDPTAHLDVHVLTHVAEELGSSIAVGAVLGGLLILYIRYVHQVMLLFVLLTILVVAEVSAVLHLELLLVFIVAGFVVRNLSPYEHELMAPLERISLPVFVVFFTTAGAGVDLVGTIGLLPLALALVAARLLAFYAAARVGGAIGGEGPAVVDNAWLTWVPQAGVTLGLVLLAANALPALSEPLTAIGMALVAIHLLVGPITLGMGLRRAGEMGKAGEVGHDAHGHEGELADPTEDAPLPRDPTIEEELPAVPIAPVRTLQDALAGLEDPAAVAQLQEVSDTLNACVDRFFTEIAEPRAEASVVAVFNRLPRMDGDLDGLLECALNAPELDHEDWLPAVTRLYDELATCIQTLPPELELAPQPAPEAHLSRHEALTVVGRLRTGLRRFTMGRARRHPALCMLAREALEPRLAEGVRLVSVSWYRADAEMCECIALGGTAARLASVARAQAADVAQDWVDGARQRMREAILDGVIEMTDALVEHASPLGQPRLPRYSRVEAAVGTSRALLVSDDDHWRDATSEASDHLRLALIVAVLQGRTSELHFSWGQQALDTMEAELLGAIDGAVAQLREVRDDLGRGEIDVTAEGWEQRMKAVFPLKARLALRLAAQNFRQSVQSDRLTNALSALLERLPEMLRVVPAPVSGFDEVHDREVHELEVARQFRSLLLDARVPEMIRALESLTPQLVASHSHLAEGVEVASYGMSVASRDAEDPKKAATESLRRSISRLESYRSDILSAIAASRERLAEEQSETERALAAVLQPASGVARVQSGMQATRRLLRSQAGTVGRRLMRAGRVVTEWVQARLEDPAVVDRAIRLGHRKLDAEQMRSRVQELTAHQLPGALAGLYADRPVDDRRQFVAYRAEMDRLRRHLSDPDPVTPLLALVEGQRGSGRTSLVNVIQLSARKLHVVRPEDAYHDRSAGLLAALARELRCGPEPASLRRALSARRTLVLVDNLERFMLPTPEGVADLAALLELAADSARTGTQWVLTIESSVLARLEELRSVGALFNQRIRLGESDGDELLTVMVSRARLGGFDVPMDPVGSRIDRVLRTPSENLARELWRTSGGNLAAAIAAWRAAVSQRDERVLELKDFVSRELPFFCQLPDVARAAAATLYAWGPMRPDQLKVALGVELSELGGHLQQLAAAGLIVAAGQRGEEWAIPEPLMEPLQRELRAALMTAGGDS